MAISVKKRRYSLTLTPSIVERFQGLCAQVGLPPATMSHVCDDVISGMSNTFQMAIDKGSIDFSDLMKLMGKQMELIENEEKERKNFKDGSCLKCGKPMHKFHDCVLNPTAVPTDRKERQCTTTRKMES